MSRPPTLRVSNLVRYQQAYLSPEAPASQARQSFRRYPRLYHLPLVDAEGRYVALFPKRSLLQVPPETPVQNLPHKEITPLPSYATIYDALQAMELHKIPEVPVVSEEGRHLGLVTTDSLVRWWSRLGAVQEPGAVIILESYLHDYSLAEIAQIFEAEDIRILSAYLLRHDSDLQKTYIVLKVNQIYLSRAIDLLERKGYRIVSLQGDQLMEKKARDHLEALLRYLKM